MGKHYIDKAVLCDCYLHEGPSMIYCFGIKDGTVIHLAFDNRASAKNYKQEFCKGKYKECPMHKLEREV